MITYDAKHKQLLTTACLNCKDPYFAPAKPTMMHVGCCSYSPVFSLFEIYKMLQDNNKEFFLESIYHHKSAEITPYEVVIHAKVDPLFEENKLEHLSTIEQEDIRLQYSVCQFFKPQKGCNLPPSYKNATCRSFICLTVEEKLNSHTKTEVKNWNILIQKEVNSFVKQHEKALKLRGINLQNNVISVLDYLQNEIE